ncbi:hypothetical protein HDU78_001046 [Chytriomyces hyalinus]|nr:hypothetical protein HDU78_001046 [Chytriomyces hyalinus]
MASPSPFPLLSDAARETEGQITEGVDETSKLITTGSLTNVAHGLPSQLRSALKSAANSRFNLAGSSSVGRSALTIVTDSIPTSASNSSLPRMTSAKVAFGSSSTMIMNDGNTTATAKALAPTSRRVSLAAKPDILPTEKSNDGKNLDHIMVADNQPTHFSRPGSAIAAPRPAYKLRPISANAAEKQIKFSGFEFRRNPVVEALADKLIETRKTETEHLNRLLLLRLANPWSSILNSEILFPENAWESIQKEYGQQGPRPPQKPRPKSSPQRKAQKTPAPLTTRRDMYFARLATPKPKHMNDPLPPDIPRPTPLPGPPDLERLERLAQPRICHKPNTDDLLALPRKNQRLREMDPVVLARLTRPKRVLLEDGSEQKPKLSKGSQILIRKKVQESTTTRQSQGYVPEDSSIHHFADADDSSDHNPFVEVRSKAPKVESVHSHRNEPTVLATHHSKLEPTNLTVSPASVIKSQMLIDMFADPVSKSATNLANNEGNEAFPNSQQATNAAPTLEYSATDDYNAFLNEQDTNETFKMEVSVPHELEISLDGPLNEPYRTEEEESAAVKLQATFRGYQLRKRMSVADPDRQWDLRPSTIQPANYGSSRNSFAGVSRSSFVSNSGHFAQNRTVEEVEDDTEPQSAFRPSQDKLNSNGEIGDAFSSEINSKTSLDDFKSAKTEGAEQSNPELAMADRESRNSLNNNGSAKRKPSSSKSSARNSVKSSVAKLASSKASLSDMHQEIPPRSDSVSKAQQSNPDLKKDQDEEFLPVEAPHEIPASHSTPSLSSSKHQIADNPKPATQVETDAAVTLQSAFRGYQTRKSLKSLNASVSNSIEKMNHKGGDNGSVRGSRDLLSLNNDNAEQTETSAAVTVQAAFRGYQTRKSLRSLNQSVQNSAEQLNRRDASLKASQNVMSSYAKLIGESESPYDSKSSLKSLKSTKRNSAANSNNKLTLTASEVKLVSNDVQKTPGKSAKSSPRNSVKGSVAKIVSSKTSLSNINQEKSSRPQSLIKQHQSKTTLNDSKEDEIQLAEAPHGNAASHSTPSLSSSKHQIADNPEHVTQIETDAAVTLQSAFRGYQTRKSLKSLNASVSNSIEKMNHKGGDNGSVRGSRDLLSLNNDNAEQTETSAAVTVQAAFRGYQTRKSLRSLNQSVKNSAEQLNRRDVSVKASQEELSTSASGTMHLNSETATSAEVDAAITVQAAFRGYQTRKSLQSLNGSKSNSMEKISNSRGGLNRSKDVLSDTKSLTSSSIIHPDKANQFESKRKSGSRNVLTLDPQTATQDEVDAAVTVQSAYRGYQTRKSLQSLRGSVSNSIEKINAKEEKGAASERHSETATRTEIDAAVTVQAAFRGYQVRKSVRSLKGSVNNSVDQLGEGNDKHGNKSLTSSREKMDTSPTDAETEAAILLQSTFRGYSVRKSLRSLHGSKFNSIEAVDASAGRHESNHSIAAISKSNVAETAEALAEKKAASQNLASSKESLKRSIANLDNATRSSSAGKSSIKHASIGSLSRLDGSISTNNIQAPLAATSSVENEAAVTVQAAFRGFKTRKELDSKNHSAVNSTEAINQHASSSGLGESRQKI